MNGVTFVAIVIFINILPVNMTAVILYHFCIVNIVWLARKVGASSAVSSDWLMEHVRFHHIFPCFRLKILNVTHGQICPLVIYVTTD